MPIDARIPLSSRNPRFSDILVERNRNRRQDQLFNLAMEDRDREIAIEDEDRRLAAEDRARAEQEAAAQKNLESIAVGAVAVRPLLDEIGSIPIAMRSLERRAAEIEARGGDASDTRELMQMIQDGNIVGARAAVDSAIQAAQARGIIRGNTTQASARNVSSTPGRIGNQPGEIVTTRGPDGTVSSEFVPFAEGFVPTSRAGETPQEESQRQVTTAGGETGARESAKRDQEFIDVAIRQADATAVIRRSLELLETMETGTPENIARQARVAFGISGADETELNANLGKAILSQLRQVFGAQFTEREGARLESIEANFGNSTAGNRRLLENILNQMERDARRGISVARRLEDDFAIQEIENALQFNLRGDQAETQTAPTGQEPQEGDIAVNPQTGERIQLRNGQWVPIG